MQVLLKTDRLVLRRFEAGDAEELFKLDNDPAVMRFINGGTPTGLEVIVGQIMPTFLKVDDLCPDFGFWAVIEGASREFLGWFSCRPVAEGTSAEVALGYRFCRAAWGKGYATEGGLALVDKCFAELGVQRLVATTYEENRASRRVLEKLGMTLVRSYRLTERDLTQAETFCASSLELWDGDDLEYALEKADWELQKRTD